MPKNLGFALAALKRKIAKLEEDLVVERALADRLFPHISHRSGCPGGLVMQDPPYVCDCGCQAAAVSYWAARKSAG